MTQAVRVKVGGAALPAVSAGPADGVPVVFLHAGVCDHRQWLAQVEAVAAASYRGIAYDRRGFGEATSPDEPFSQRDDLLAVLDHFAVDRAVLVGCSMGGGLAIDFALEHPERVRALVPVGTALSGGEYHFSGNDEEIENLLEAAEKRGDVDEQLKADAHAWLDGPRSPEGRVGGAARELFLDMNRKALTWQPELTQHQRAATTQGRLKDIAAPVLLIVGDLDFNYIIRRHRDLAEAISSAREETMPGTAHLPNLEQPEAFNALLLAFLRQVSPP